VNFHQCPMRRGLIAGISPVREFRPSGVNLIEAVGGSLISRAASRRRTGDRRRRLLSAGAATATARATTRWQRTVKYGTEVATAHAVDDEVDRRVERHQKITHLRQL